MRAMRAAVRADEPDDFVIATGISHSIEDFVSQAFAAAGITDWRAHVAVDEGCCGRRILRISLETHQKPNVCSVGARRSTLPDSSR